MWWCSSRYSSVGFLCSLPQCEPSVLSATTPPPRFSPSGFLVPVRSTTPSSPQLSPPAARHGVAEECCASSVLDTRLPTANRPSTRLTHSSSYSSNVHTLLLITAGPAHCRIRLGARSRATRQTRRAGALPLACSAAVPRRRLRSRARRTRQAARLVSFLTCFLRVALQTRKRELTLRSVSR